MFIGRAEAIIELDKVTNKEHTYSNGCNYTDLCDDADAIGLSRIMNSKSVYTHILSDSMEEYYDSLSTVKRYSQYQYDNLSFSSLNNLYEDLCSKLFVTSASVLDILKGEATEEIERAACRAFANYIWYKINAIESVN